MVWGRSGGEEEQKEREGMTGRMNIGARPNWRRDFELWEANMEKILVLASAEAWERSRWGGVRPQSRVSAADMPAAWVAWGGLLTGVSGV